MSQRRKSVDATAQHRVAQKYRLLGYEVEENPETALLPEFMRGVSPDILARSQFDNVVVEVKERSALKGSNDLVGIAQRISERPEWRFELVVLPTKRDQARSAIISTNYDDLLEKIQIAANVRLPEIAYIYLANIMVGQGHDLAKRHNVRVKGKTDRDLFLDLNFKGVLPEEMTQDCLSVLSMRNELAHIFDEAVKPSDKDLTNLLQLCRHLEELS
jgi:uncharacterized protein YutE (UPF0331/DUF86 family)